MVAMDASSSRSLACSRRPDLASRPAEARFGCCAGQAMPPRTRTTSPVMTRARSTSRPVVETDGSRRHVGVGIIGTFSRAIAAGGWVVASLQGEIDGACVMGKVAAAQEPFECDCRRRRVAASKSGQTARQRILVVATGEVSSEPGEEIRASASRRASIRGTPSNGFSILICCRRTSQRTSAGTSSAARPPR